MLKDLTRTAEGRCQGPGLRGRDRTLKLTHGEFQNPQMHIVRNAGDATV